MHTRLETLPTAARGYVQAKPPYHTQRKPCYAVGGWRGQNPCLADIFCTGLTHSLAREETFMRRQNKTYGSMRCFFAAAQCFIGVALESLLAILWQSAAEQSGQ
jgi:hypothetical protein